MLSGIASYLFGGASEEEHPAAATASAEELARSMGLAAPSSDDPTTSQPDPIRLKERLAEDDDWTIVDRASRSSSPACSPLENLLIEHPSMSVYNTRGRPSSRGVDSEDSSESSMDCTTAPPEAATVSARGRTSRNVRQAPSHRPITQAVAASRRLVKSTRSMQAAARAHEACKHTRGHIARNNRARLQQSVGRQQHRRKQHQAARPSGVCNDRKSQ